MPRARNSNTKQRGTRTITSNITVQEEAGDRVIREVYGNLRGEWNGTIFDYLLDRCIFTKSAETAKALNEKMLNGTPGEV